MPRWTEEQLKEYEQRRQREDPAGSVVSGSKPERAICNDTLGAPLGKEKNTPRFRVRITSFRKRLLDPDNLAGGCKYFLDCCRYTGLIPDDAPDQIIFESRQEKVSSSVEEYTEVIIEEIV